MRCLVLVVYGVLFALAADGVSVRADGVRRRVTSVVQKYLPSLADGGIFKRGGKLRSAVQQALMVGALGATLTCAHGCSAATTTTRWDTHGNDLIERDVRWHGHKTRSLKPHIIRESFPYSKWVYGVEREFSESFYRKFHSGAMTSSDYKGTLVIYRHEGSYFIGLAWKTIPYDSDITMVDHLRLHATLDRDIAVDRVLGVIFNHHHDYGRELVRVLETDLRLLGDYDEVGDGYPVTDGDAVFYGKVRVVFTNGARLIWITRMRASDGEKVVLDDGFWALLHDD